MKYENSDETTTTTDPSNVGITSTELTQATSGSDSSDLNLSCSDLACHIAISEFELVFLSSN